MDDIKPEDQLTKKIKGCQKTARKLKKEFESLIQVDVQQQKSTNTTDDSAHSVKQLLDIDLAIESIQQQLKLVYEKYLSTQAALPTSEDLPMIQSDDNQMEEANVMINEQVKLSNDNTDQNEAKLNSPVQAHFTGTLPDDVYTHLLSVMGIQDCLISNRLVCSFWNKLVLERCNNQKSLKLFETFDVLMKYGELLLNYEKAGDTSLILKSIGDDLLFEGLGIDHKQLVHSLNPDVILTREKQQEASKVLTTLFPKIEELVLCTEEVTLINIEHLLQFYAEQLTSLTMNSFGPWHESPDSQLRAFSFPKLKSLNTFGFSPQDAQLLSLLPQLESLTLPGSEISLETLLRTGTCLRELNMDFIRFLYTAPEDAFSKRPPINSNLRKFSFGHSIYNLQALEFISRNLASLECLKLYLNYYGANLHSLTSHLASLHQLHSLTLEAPVSIFLLDDPQLAEIKPLPSVRQLKLLLSEYTSLSMDLFSRALFAAFPKVEKVLIAIGNGVRVGTATLAAFEAFAGKHPNVVQLFRSKDRSKFTALPNAVSPLLGHHRQIYEEYIQEEELFGVAICKLTAYLVAKEGEDGPNLKSALRPADRLSAMSNLIQLLECDAFVFPFEKVNAMIQHMFNCALTYGPSQGALFSVTCKCVLSLLDCRAVDEFDTKKEAPFLYHKSSRLYSFFEMILDLVKHSKTQQLDDKKVLLQLCKRIVDFLTKFDSEKCLNAVLIKLLRSENRRFRVEMARALARCCKSTDGYFKLLSGEADSDSSEGDSGDSDSSDSGDSTSDGSFSSAESEPELPIWMTNYNCLLVKHPQHLPSIFQ